MDVQGDQNSQHTVEKACNCLNTIALIKINMNIILYNKWISKQLNNIQGKAVNMYVWLWYVSWKALMVMTVLIYS